VLGDISFKRFRPPNTGSVSTATSQAACSEVEQEMKWGGGVLLKDSSWHILYIAFLQVKSLVLEWGSQAPTPKGGVF
jgi:hypothetical protein